MYWQGVPVNQYAKKMNIVQIIRTIHKKKNEIQKANIRKNAPLANKEMQIKTIPYQISPITMVKM